MYLALEINTEGNNGLMGPWISEHEGSKFWMSVLTEFQRGVTDIFIPLLAWISYLVPVTIKPHLECPKRPLFVDFVGIVPGTDNI